MKYYSYISFLILGIIASGCSSKNDSQHLLNEPMSEIIQSTENFGDDADSTPTQVQIKKDLLDKDLMLGGVITDVNIIPENQQGDMVLDHFAPKLVRLFYEEESKSLVVKTSPRKPWTYDDPSRFQKEIARLEVKSVTPDGELVVDLSDFAKSFYSAYKSAASDASEASLTSYIDIRHKVIVGADYISFPIEISYQIDRADALCLLRMYLKAWTPKPEFEERHVNKNYGFFTVFSQYEQYVQYPEIEEKTPEDLILRWDFKNLKSPIVYTISKDVPADYREALVSGIEAWNEPLKQMLKRTDDVISAHVQKDDEEVTPGDLATNFIFWENSPKRGVAGMHASWQADPISGEIFHGDVYVGGAALVNALSRSYTKYYEGGSNGKTNWSTTLGNFKLNHICSIEPQRREQKGILNGNISKEEFVKAWIKEAIIHELGHNFGLRHNFKGSLSVDVEKNILPNSVMDYNSDDIAISGLVMNTPGVYDIKALEWAEFGDQASDALGTLPFCTDEQTGNGNMYFDPKCRLYDFGSDPLNQDIIPNIRLIHEKVFTASEKYDVERYKNRLYRDLVGSLSFLSLRASVDERTKVNEIFSEVLLKTKSTYGAHEQAPEILQTIIQGFLTEIIGDVQNQHILDESMSKTLTSLVVDLSSPVQISIKNKITILDLLMALSGNNWQETQFLAWNTLKNIHDGLKKQQIKQSFLSGSLTAQEQFTMSQIDRLVFLTEDRMAVFFGVKREK